MARFRTVTLLFTAITALGLLGVLGCNTGSGGSGNTAPLGPNVVATVPATGSQRVSILSTFTVTFDTEMEAVTFREANNRPNVQVVARVGGTNFTIAENAITLQPATGATRTMTISALQNALLPYDALMTVTLNTNIRTFNPLNPGTRTGIPLPANFSFTFATEHDTILVNEVCAVNPQGAAGVADFIEVINGTADTITLTNYWLTDGTENFGANRFYINVQTQPSNATYSDAINTAVGAVNTNVLDCGGGRNGDFLAKFPDGSQILSGQRVVVAFNGGNFTAAFPTAPAFNFELFNTDANTGNDMDSFDVATGGTLTTPQPQVVADRPNSVTGSPNTASTADLDPTGECVVLFFYARNSGATVEDVDYVIWGDATTGGEASAKSGVALTGAGQAQPSAAFRTETAVVNQRPILNDPAAAGQVHLAGNSMTREDPFEIDGQTGNPVTALRFNSELYAGGNGISVANKRATGLGNTKTRTDPGATTGGVPTPFSAQLQFQAAADERHDEMSEPLDTTFTIAAAASPGQ